jgi:manganese/zinc/iron transport system permease protein
MEFNWDSLDTWTVVIGGLSAVAAAMPGCFLVLRRMSMMGDAISHAILPGIAMAFLLTHTRITAIMFIGAACAGLLTAAFTQCISKYGKVDRGAAMGIVFTTLFAIGLILIRQSAKHVELDPGCVLYGALEYSVIDLVQIGAIEVPRAVISIGSVMCINILFIVFLYKELAASSFDPSLADTLGFNSGLIHYLLMVVVAVTTVAAFEALGSIIVIAMLIVPPATALLLTQRLAHMLVLSALLGLLSAFLGHLGATVIPPAFGFQATVSSGMMAVAAGALFLCAWVFSPRQGLFFRLGERRQHRGNSLPPPAGEGS